MKSAYSKQLGAVIAQSVGRRVRSLRKQKKLTQFQLAARAGSHAPIISRLERGVSNPPTLETLAPVARALGISVRDLLLGLNWRRIDSIARTSLVRSRARSRSATCFFIDPSAHSSSRRQRAHV